MTLFERLRGWLTPSGRDIGDKRYGEAVYEAALDRTYDEVLAEGERMAWRLKQREAEAEWEDEGGAPAGQVPNCS